jgi:hypothetical protein
MRDVTYMSAKDFGEIEKSAKEKMMARNRAASAIEDALARYIKTKTRAKSRKAALEKDAAINSQRFAKLSTYERREDIQEAFGWGIVTESERDRLEDLWDERESIKTASIDGVYSDLTTQCLEKARHYVLGLFEDEISDYDDTKRAWDKQLAQFEEEKRQRQEEYKKWKNGWTGASV